MPPSPGGRAFATLHIGHERTQAVTHEPAARPHDEEAR